METAVSSGGLGIAEENSVPPPPPPSTTTEPRGAAAERATVAPFQEKTAKGHPPEISRRSPSWSSAPKISALPQTSYFWLERGKRKEKR